MVESGSVVEVGINRRLKLNTASRISLFNPESKIEMEFDFRDQFKNSSNAELLKIVERPEDYQSGAVEAATEILKNREVSDEEIHLTENYFFGKDQAARLKKEKAESIQNNLADFLEPIIKPGPSVQTRKWINLFLVFLVIQYLRSIFYITKSIIGIVQGDWGSAVYLVILYDISYLLYVPFLLFLLYKKRRWGWILLFTDQFVSLLMSVSSVWFYFKYRSVLHGQTVSWLFWIFLRAAFVFFLWQEQIVSYFNVPRPVKEKTAMASILLFLVVLSIFKIYNN